MVSTKRFISWTQIGVVALALGIGGSALSQPYGYGYGPGMGPGMMGPGMMGPGMMGPGMMGPGVMGPGMMGPGMMGPGMMGPGMMGPGMMGGWGMGPGMYGWVPDLSDAQRSEIAKIREELSARENELALKLNEEQGRLQSMWYSEKRDPAKIREQNRKVFDLRRQMMDAMYDAQAKLDEVLTKEQRERMWQQGYGWR